MQRVFPNIWMVVAIATVLPPTYSAGAQRRFRASHQAMGTVWTLDLYAKDPATAARLAEEAFDTVDRIDDELSNYNPASELERISHEAGVAPVTTDPETFAFLERALHWSRASDGAFDITVGPLLRAWGFFFHDGRIPAEAELKAIRNKIGYDRIVLDPATRSVRFRDGMSLDLDPGSIGKGFAVDRVVQQLRDEGVTSAFLSAGGSTLYGIGTPPGKAGWPVLVPDPRKPHAPPETILLRDTSLSTGACTEKFFIRDSHRYCHIFNPTTIRPVEGMLQTSVIDPSATDSDALSTIAFVLTTAKARSFFRSRLTSSVLLFRLPNAQPDCVAVRWPKDGCSRSHPSHQKGKHK